MILSNNHRREQFLQWLTFCDGRYSDFIKDVEQLETMTEMATLHAPVQELPMKLYAILSSYLQGPALQIVRANSAQRNGFAVWHRLQQLYAPRARPRALAIGQAIMQHPSFPQHRSMLVLFWINMSWLLVIECLTTSQ